MSDEIITIDGMEFEFGPYLVEELFLSHLNWTPYDLGPALVADRTLALEQWVDLMYHAKEIILRRRHEAKAEKIDKPVDAMTQGRTEPEPKSPWRPNMAVPIEPEGDGWQVIPDDWVGPPQELVGDAEAFYGSICPFKIEVFMGRYWAAPRRLNSGRDPDSAFSERPENLECRITHWRYNPEWVAEQEGSDDA